MGLPGECVRAGQDLACALHGMGRSAAAERQLMKLLSETDWAELAPAHGFQNLLKLAEVLQAQGKNAVAREWLDRSDTLAGAEVPALAEHLARHHVVSKRHRLRLLVAHS